MIPIVQSTTFKYDTSEDMGKLFDLEESGYFYTRLANPTNDYVRPRYVPWRGISDSAHIVRTGEEHSSRYSTLPEWRSRCGIIHHIRRKLQPFAVTMKRMGVEFTFVDPDCSDEELEARSDRTPRPCLAETIANPALIVFDIERFANAAHAHGVPLIVDNTFATPISCRPIEWGRHSHTLHHEVHGRT